VTDSSSWIPACLIEVEVANVEVALELFVVVEVEDGIVLGNNCVMSLHANVTDVFVYADTLQPPHLLYVFPS
jgi:hypothetical protein